MKPKHKRLFLVSALAVIMLSSAALMLANLKAYAVFFVTPKDIAALDADQKVQRLRLGGLVTPRSVHQDADGTLHFTITDNTASIAVTYKGIIPSLFREGQGVVVEGTLHDKNHFNATHLLAKHDENYMPAEVVDALKESGRWQHEKTAPK